MTILRFCLNNLTAPPLRAVAILLLSPPHSCATSQHYLFAACGGAWRTINSFFYNFRALLWHAGGTYKHYCRL